VLTGAIVKHKLTGRKNLKRREYGNFGMLGTGEKEREGMRDNNNDLAFRGGAELMFLVP